ncbi:MAG: septum formation initiator family protein [Nakamurella sp.]
MSVRPGGRGSGAGNRRSGAAARRSSAEQGSAAQPAAGRSAPRSVSATRRPRRSGGSGPASDRRGGSPGDGGLGRRNTRQIAPRAGQRRRVIAVVRSPLARQIVALGVALSVVALSLAYPLRGYLQQQAAEQQAVVEQLDLETQVGDLEAQISALKDPAYIRAEAKRRLQYVTPGDTVYVVKLPPALAAQSESASRAPGPTAATTTDGAANLDGAITAGQESPGATVSQPGASITPGSTEAEPWYKSLWGTLRDSQD